MTQRLDHAPTDSPPRPPRSPRRRGRGWWVLAAVLMVGTVGWGVLQLVSILAHDERVETASFSTAEVTSLRVENANGRVVVSAAETSTISVTAEISAGLRATGESREVVDGVLVLRTTCPLVGSTFCWTNYDIEVPRGLPITVVARNGRIEVTGSAAPLDLNGDNGNVVLDGVSGPVSATTDNGSIRGTALAPATIDVDSDNGSVTLEFALAPTTVEATTDNGSVEVVVPDDGVAYQVDLSTGNGREEQDVRVDPTSPRVLTLHTDNGRVTARTAP